MGFAICDGTTKAGAAGAAAEGAIADGNRRGATSWPCAEKAATARLTTVAIDEHFRCVNQPGQCHEGFVIAVFL